MQKKPTYKSQVDELKSLAEADLLTFIRLVAPKRAMGQVHRELISWWTRGDQSSHQLVLLPRGHQKSTFIAYRVCWEITKNPAVTIMYLSATAGLAEAQLGLIKTILESPIYRRYWPQMVHPEVGQRTKWSMSEITVDHPLRAMEQVRDPTVFTAGLTTNMTGRHCDIAVLDDVVINENAYTEDGREKTKLQYSLLASIENPGAKEWIVGTRYHPNDLYSSLIDMKEEVYDENGDIIDSHLVYELFERQVEDRGDGTGEFLWPAERRPDGKVYGFNRELLAKIRAKYMDKTQYYAQYYNDPNVGESSGIAKSRFQYYDRKLVVNKDGKWYIRGKHVNVFAAVDFAFSLSKKADYSAIVVIGMDSDGNIYILDTERFRTDKISAYFEHIRNLHVKWNFRKLRAETTVAQQAIVRELKDQYFKPHGLAISVDEHHPSRHEGSKEERIQAILGPRYENMVIWHYQGGNCHLLEEELIQAHPAHDDLKDALAAACDIAVPPRGFGSNVRGKDDNVIYTNGRFGGMGI